MEWVVIAIICYLIQAFVHLFDKMLLDNGIKDPKEYVFWVSAPLILAIVFIPFVGFSLPSDSAIILTALVAGFIFNCALYWLFKGIQRYEATRIIPAVSGLLPVFSYFLIYVFFQQIPPLIHIWASGLLVLGTIILNYRKEKLFSKEAILLSVWTALLLSCAFLLSKISLDKIGHFATAFILIKLGGFLVAPLIWMVSKDVRRALCGNSREQNKFRGLLFGNQFLAATGNILQNLAISLAPMGLLGTVQAMEGVKHGAMFFLGWAFSIAIPEKFRENFSTKAILVKVAGILFICAGLYLISI